LIKSTIGRGFRGQARTAAGREGIWVDCFRTTRPHISFGSAQFKAVSSKSAFGEAVWISRRCFGSGIFALPSLRERRTFPRCTTSYPPCLPPRPHRRSPTFPMPPVSYRVPGM